MQTLDLPIEIVANYHCVCGEGPIWHDTEKALYWVDIPTGRLLRYDPATGQHDNVYTGRFIGAVTIQTDDSLLLLGQDCEVLIYKDGETKTVIEGIPDETRFNDAIADPQGRVFSGSMPADAPDRDGEFNDGRWSRLGKLYRIDPDGSYRVVDEGFGCANGMGFTPDGKGLYFTDTHAGTIYRYDYDAATGKISNREPFFQQPRSGPDGMTMDQHGNIWSARWGQSRVVKHDAKTGEMVAEFPLPTANITCIAFGHDDRATAYITSAGGDPKTADRNNPAGALFKTVIPGVHGVPEHRSAVGI